MDDFLSSEDVDRPPVIKGHSTNLIQDVHSYFPDTEVKSAQVHWVRNPFLWFEANKSKPHVTDRGLQMEFATSTQV